MSAGSMAVAGDRATLKSLCPDRAPAAFLGERERIGIFVWKEGDYSSVLEMDPFEGVFLASGIRDPRKGAWMRCYDGDALNVRWFGAAGDGSADDALAIQGAVDFADSRGGGAVFLPPGAYRMRCPLSLRNDVVIRGSGIFETSLRFEGAAGIAATQSQPVMHAGLERLQVMGAGAADSIGVALDGCEAIRLANVRVSGFGRAALALGVQSGDATACLFENVDLLGGDNAAELGGAGRADRNSFRNCRFSGAVLDGLDLVRGSANSVLDCAFLENGREGARIGDADNHFRACVASDNGGYGFRFLDADDVVGNSVQATCARNGLGDHVDLADLNTFSLSGDAGQSGLKLGAVDIDDVADGALWRDPVGGQLMYRDGAGKDVCLNGASVSFAARMSADRDLDGAPDDVCRLVFDDREFDAGGDYDTTAGAFIAPADGQYQFNVMVRSEGDVDSLMLETPLAAFVADAGASESATLVVSALARMREGDRAVATLRLNGNAVRVLGDDGGSSFSGFLVG